MKNHWAIIALFGLIFLFFASRVEKKFPHDLHVDEAHWVVFAISDMQNYREGDFGSPYWTLRHPFAGMTPSGGKLMFGMPLLWFSESNLHPRYVHYNWKKSPVENRADGCLPSDRSILICRYVSYAFFCVACLTLYVILSSISIIVALLSFFLLFFNPLFQMLGGLALLDSMEYAFTFLSLYFFLSHLKKEGTARVFLAGVLAGFACSVKMRGILPLIFFNGFYCVRAWKKAEIIDPEKKTPILKQALILNLAFLLAFLLMNPAMLFSPKEKMSLFLELSTFHSETLSKSRPEFALKGWRMKGEAIFQHAIQKYGNTTFWQLELLLYVAGVFVAIRHLRRSKSQEHFWFLAFFLFLFIANVIWIPLAFERYFMPFIFLLKILESLSLNELIERGYRAINRGSAEQPAPPGS